MAAFSNNVKVTNFQYKSTEPMYSNQSWTGQRIMRSTGIQYAEIQFTLNFTKDAYKEVSNFLAQYSQGKAFTLSLGALGNYYGNQTGALTAAAAATKGSIVIRTNTNQLAVGEVIQFTNHNKLYKIIDTTSTSITVFPALQNQVQAGEVIRYDSLIIEAVLDPDNDYTIPVGNVMTIQLKATENIT